MYKNCKRCNIEKEIISFCKNKSKKDGLEIYCRECNKEYKKEHYIKNKKIISEKHKTYYLENKETIIEKVRELHLLGKSNSSKCDLIPLKLIFLYFGK